MRMYTVSTFLQLRTRVSYPRHLPDLFAITAYG
jgi:hypothetical protein